MHQPPQGGSEARHLRVKDLAINHPAMILQWLLESEPKSLQTQSSRREVQWARFSRAQRLLMPTDLTKVSMKCSTWTAEANTRSRTFSLALACLPKASLTMNQMQLTNSQSLVSTNHMRTKMADKITRLLLWIRQLPRTQVSSVISSASSTSGLQMMQKDCTYQKIKKASTTGKYHQLLSPKFWTKEHSCASSPILLGTCGSTTPPAQRILSPSRIIWIHEIWTELASQRWTLRALMTKTCRPGCSTFKAVITSFSCRFCRTRCRAATSDPQCRMKKERKGKSTFNFCFINQRMPKEIITKVLVPFVLAKILDYRMSHGRKFMILEDDLKVIFIYQGMSMVSMEKMVWIQNICHSKIRRT